MAYSELVESLKGKLIVSVQAYPGEPMRHPETMAQIARACELGGAAAIRCHGILLTRMYVLFYDMHLSASQVSKLFCDLTLLA